MFSGKIRIVCNGSLPMRPPLGAARSETLLAPTPKESQIVAVGNEPTAAAKAIVPMFGNRDGPRVFPMPLRATRAKDRFPVFHHTHAHAITT
jgi:hypothetical protein